MQKQLCYEMRLESIGGLGANLCGKMLGELGARYLGLNASAFSEYGSEKRGSPVKAYVRWSEGEILHNSPVERPQILALFHLALASTLPVTAGVDEHAHVIVNTAETPEATRNALRLHAGTVYTIDASQIAKQTKSRVNTVMLGAICKATGRVSLDTLKTLVTDVFSKKYPASVAGNLAGAEAGYNGARMQTFAPDSRFPYLPYRQATGKWGYANAPLGGCNPHFGSTVSNDLSPSREGFVPLFHVEKCIHCGLCDSTCPDMVFQFSLGEYRGKPTICNQGLDYRHCKGCLRCVQVCPTGALTAGLERDNKDKMRYVRNKDLIVERLDFEKTGADAYVTGESVREDL